jgi:regulator of sigma E protease
MTYTYTYMLLIILGVLLLIGVVVLHELGHFYAARKSGVEVEEFGIGFPPRAKVLGEKNGTTYTLNWLPLGGFVKLKGEHDSDTTPGSFGAARLIDKVKIMVAGVIVNALTAIILFSLIALAGLPKVFENQFSVASDNTVVTQEVLIADVSEGSPAAQAGLELRDDVTKISGNQDFEITSAESLGQATEALAGQNVTVTFNRNGEEKQVQTVLRDTETVEQSRQTDQPQGFLGVIPVEYIEQRATWSAPIVGVVFTGQVALETFSVFGNVIADLTRGDTSTAQENVTGIVGIGDILGQLSQQGFKSVMLLVALISLSLAIMNILPIPALDGGRLFVTLLFRAIRRPLTQETEERIHGTGFALLMVLFVLITIVDVQRITGN